MPWDVEKLVATLEAKRGEEARERIAGPARTVWKRLFAVEYHYQESQRILKEIVPDDDLFKGVRGIVGLVPGYRVAIFEAEAHVNAAAVALHTLGDVMAKVIWEALYLEPTFGNNLSPRKRYLFNVNELMKTNGIAPGITGEADLLLTHGAWKKLADFVNTSKHHSLVAMPPTVTYGTFPKHGLQINPFGKWSDPEWSNTFLERAHRAVEDRVVGMGIELNKELGI